MPLDEILYARPDDRPQPAAGIPLVPETARVMDVVRENPQTVSLILSWEDPLRQARFSFVPGQFMMLSLPHLGEAPISISSAPREGAPFTLTVRRAGRLTAAAQQLRPGDTVGLRGPLGQGFAMEEIQDRHLLLVAGGIGLAPLRPVLWSCLEARDRVEDPARRPSLCLLYGARSPEDFCFRKDIETWQEAGVDCRLTIDRPAPGWEGRVGLVTELLDHDLPETEKALVCGPEIMIRFVIQRLEELGLGREEIHTTLERHMKCGVGTCGHCHMDGRLICVDGPVFRADQAPGGLLD